MINAAERVAVSLPKSIIIRLERARKHLQINRSKLFLLALIKYLDSTIEEEDKKLEKIYKEIEVTDKGLLMHFSSSSYKNLPPYGQD